MVTKDKNINLRTKFITIQISYYTVYILYFHKTMIIKMKHNIINQNLSSICMYNVNGLYFQTRGLLLFSTVLSPITFD